MPIAQPIGMKGYRATSIERDGARLVFHREEGAGPVFVFQHGLCGSAAQPAAVFPHGCGARHMVLDCRGHGASDAGLADSFSIATFADDVAAMIEASGAGSCIVGGISMGAAIALRLACMRPDLVSGLVLARPAWVTEAAPYNMRPNLEVGEILKSGAGPSTRADFLASETGRKLAAEAPDNLASLSGFFEREPHEVTAALLTRIARDGPGVSRDQVRALDVPALVIGHGIDIIHPLGHAIEIAHLIPQAQLVEIPPKATSPDGYASGMRDALCQFVKETSHAQA